MNESHESRSRQLEYARLVSVGLATAHLAVTVIGVLVSVAGWLAASGLALTPRRRGR